VAEIETRINSYIKELVINGDSDQSQTEAFSEVRFNKFNFLSLSHKSQSYKVGGKAANAQLKCDNFELDTGNKIKLNDIMRQGFRKRMRDVLRIVSQDDAVNKIPKYVRKIIREADSEIRIAPDQSYYITNQDLVVCFDEIMFGNASYSSIEIALPYSSIKGLINPNSALAFAVGSKPNMPSPLNPLPKPITNIRLPSGTASSTSVEYPAGRTPIVNRAPSKAPLNKTNVYLSYTCTNARATHRINAIRSDQAAASICEVEYYKNQNRSILWRSFESMDFCAEKTEDLVEKYENKWKWSCNRHGS